MSIFWESPVPILVIGIVLEAILGAILVNTRRVWVVWPMLGVLLLVAAGVAATRLVVTENKRIMATLDGAAAALEANDLDQVSAYVVPGANQTRNRARQVLDAVEFTSVGLRGVEIGEINRLTSPPTVETRFTVVLRFKDRTNMYPYDHYVVGLIVHLRKDGDRWLVTDHIEIDPNNPVSRNRR